VFHSIIPIRSTRAPALDRSRDHAFRTLVVESQGGAVVPTITHLALGHADRPTNRSITYPPHPTHARAYEHNLPNTDMAITSSTSQTPLSVARSSVASSATGEPNLIPPLFLFFFGFPYGTARAGQQLSHAGRSPCPRDWGASSTRVEGEYPSSPSPPKK
jgi:hypothetical protein